MYNIPAKDPKKKRVAKNCRPPGNMEIVKKIIIPTETITNPVRLSEPNVLFILSMSALMPSPSSCWHLMRKEV